ncbi:MAG: hypothetical protein HQM13_16295 [SAR324 cluster bacterium]|nr:hypothetical protein [SAR324 cluster bacterium]
MKSSEIKKLFEDYCHNNNIVLQNTAEIESAIHTFTQSLDHHLIRLLYLDQLTEYPVEFSNPIKEVQDLLKEFPVQDAFLKKIREQTFSLGDDLKEVLEVERKYYSLIQHESLQSISINSPGKEWGQLLKNFNLQERLKQARQVETLDHFDEIYDGEFKALLRCLEESQSQEPGSPEFQKSTMPVLPIIDRLVRRGEIGLELINLVLQGRFSYLCFVQLIATRGKRFDDLLKKGMIISRLDMLHEYQLLKTELFLSLRKQSVGAIENELQNRSKMIQLLHELYRNKWIDPKQIETILKNCRVQATDRPLATLEGFKVKKEIGILIRSKVKGTAQETEIMNQLAELMKSIPDLNRFWQELLAGQSWKKREAGISIDDISKGLGKYIRVGKKPAAGQRPKSQSPRNEKVSKQESSTPVGKTSLSETLESLRKQISDAAEVLQGLAEYEGKKAISELKEDQLLFPETQRLFKQKLDVFQQNLKNKMLKLKDSPEALLQKWQIEIKQNLKVDTDAYKLLELLKDFQGDWNLTEEELIAVKDIDLPAQERACWVEQCHQKYSLLDSLFVKKENLTQLGKLHYERESAILMNILQDILQTDPFYFENKSLSSLKDVLPPLESEQINASRQIATDLFKAKIGSKLLFNLFRWGVFILNPPNMNQLKKALLDNDDFEQKRNDWEKFKNSAVSKEMVQKLIARVSPTIASNMDQTGKNVVTSLKQLVNLPDEEFVKEVSKKMVDSLVHSLMTTEYIVKIRAIIECFLEIESSLATLELTGAIVLPNPASIAKRFFGILALDDYEQRIELLVEQVIQIFAESSAIAKEGKQLYEELLGDEY